ncbi:hypothetical protein [Loktanella sp. M215]|uniref:hypothetical protein n=1 Tax=Loktanella sp. M215 TaxID=2675431 RepID=UPI001F3145FB|nr:hypothetical protein [Loktanella sp. M215]MCF7699222.1 hypothetical protein [Loktanella sp. M215]
MDEKEEEGRGGLREREREMGGELGGVILIDILSQKKKIRNSSIFFRVKVPNKAYFQQIGNLHFSTIDIKGFDLVKKTIS